LFKYQLYEVIIYQ